MTIRDIDSSYKPTWNFHLEFGLFCDRDFRTPVKIAMNSKVTDVNNSGRVVLICPKCKRRLYLPCDSDILAFKLDVDNVEQFYEKVNQFNGHYIQPDIQNITMRKG